MLVAVTFLQRVDLDLDWLLAGEAWAMSKEASKEDASYAELLDYQLLSTPYIIGVTCNIPNEWLEYAWVRMSGFFRNRLSGEICQRFSISTIFNM